MLSIDKAGCSQGGYCHPPLFDPAIMPQAGYGPCNYFYLHASRDCDCSFLWEDSIV